MRDRNKKVGGHSPGSGDTGTRFRNKKVGGNSLGSGDQVIGTTKNARGQERRAWGPRQKLGDRLGDEGQKQRSGARDKV